MIRRSILALALLLLLPAPPLQAQPVEDLTTVGSYPEFARAIATRRQEVILKHPVVEQRLRDLTGPYYDRISKLARITAVGYQAPFEVVITDYTVDTGDRPSHQRDVAMIVVDWTTATVAAALRIYQGETIVFFYRRELNELPAPLWQFVLRNEISALLGKAYIPPEDGSVRVLDYRDTPPEIWPPKRQP